MSRVLHLYNTFTKCKKPVELSGKLVKQNHAGQVLHGSLYICGPTVYSDSHMGHAVTYIRADLLRRFLKSIFNVKLVTVMNITDIDDKILAKTYEEHGNQLKDASTAMLDPERHPFNLVAAKYYQSFLDDMNSVRVAPPDMCIKVSEHVDSIIKFISRLEKNGQAYISDDKDVCFSVRSVPNYKGLVDPRKLNLESTKRDPRDFVLWKAAKPMEPVWTYTSPTTGEKILGRPGWHVQCSAISSTIFGRNLDFHYGGKDLIFPHHYNEEACSCAYHNLDTSESLHVWSKNWLHSGHLVLKDSKMSKSLGNVVFIKDFVNRTSVNALRLLCVNSGYRSDVNFDEHLIERAKALDHKVKAFNSFLADTLKQIQENLSLGDDDTESIFLDSEIESAIANTYEEIVTGVCDDFDLDKGLESVLNLARLLYSKSKSTVQSKDIVAASSLFSDWCDMCGLDYGIADNLRCNNLLEVLLKHRQNVRSWAVSELKTLKEPKDPKSRSESLKILLQECDRVRTEVDELGYVVRDPKS